LHLISPIDQKPKKRASALALEHWHHRLFPQLPVQHHSSFTPGHKTFMLIIDLGFRNLVRSFYLLFAQLTATSGVMPHSIDIALASNRMHNSR
jgi:hypothetical protein